VVRTPAWATIQRQLDRQLQRETEEKARQPENKPGTRYMTNQGAQQNELHSTNEVAGTTETVARATPTTNRVAPKVKITSTRRDIPMAEEPRRGGSELPGSPRGRHRHHEPERQKEQKPCPRKTHSNQQSGAISDLHQYVA
jgi:hypothetical protein